MVNGEMSQQREHKTLPAPTTLHLFRFSQVERLNTEQKVSSTEQFISSSVRTVDASIRLIEETNNRLDRSDKTAIELKQQLMNLKSSAACGAVFLKMNEELPNLSPQELMDFFRLFLNIERQRLEYLTGKKIFSPDQQAKIRADFVIKERRDKEFLRFEALVQREAGDPPGWFKGGKKSWDQFVMSHNYVLDYLNSDLKSTDDDSMRLGVVLPGEYPDWVSDEGITPTKDVVQRELDEDMNAVRMSLTEMEMANKHYEYMEDNLQQKLEKTQSWFNEQSNKLFPKRKKFVDYILRLYSKEKIWESFSQEKYIKPDQSSEDIIKEFLDSKDFIANPQVVTFFIEKSLRESGMIDGADNPLDDRVINLFNQLFESINSRDKENPSVKRYLQLRETNKKVFQSLNYDIKPFFELLDEEEVTYLRELLEIHRNNPIEGFIWDIAETVSSHFTKKESEEKEKLKNKISHSLNHPIASFLRNSWKWLYNALRDSLLKKTAASPISTPTLTANEIESNAISSIATVEEIESTIKELRDGNLLGWHILYSTNKTTDPKHLVEIPGTTLDDREKEMDVFFRAEGIHPSIKTSSIINTLDRLPTVPDTVEWMRMRQGVNGQDFKKIKRGKGRIFYQMDPEKKQIIFFYVQKQAWSYEFKSS